MRQNAIDLIKKHPIIAFFILAIALSFGLLFPVVLFIPQTDMVGQILGFYLSRIGVYSPVLAGMFVARIIHPEHHKISLSRRLAIFIPVLILAEIIQIFSLKQTSAPGTPLILLVVISLPAALLPALVLTSAYSGVNGVKKMLRTLIKPTGKTVFYLIALLTFPLIQISGAVITNILNNDPWFPRVTNGVDLVFTLLVTFFSVLLFSGGINEESGWRGFAQKRMQAQYSPLVTSIILWALLVIWHIPNDLVQYKQGGYLLVRFALYPFITILFSWVYNRTHGSILAAAVFHASMNSMNPIMRIFPITTAGNILLVSFAIIVVISDRMWLKLPEHHPAAFQDVESTPAVSSPV